MGIVIIAALVSDRLRRRDDVAEALGAPVRLSVGTLRRRRWLPGCRAGPAKRNLDMRRVVAYLQRTVPGSSRGPAGLAVVAVDNAQVVAQAVVSLAVSYASQGKQVVVADLSSGAMLARLLGVRNPGVHAVSQDGAHLMVVLPDRDDVAPVGPLPGGLSRRARTGRLRRLSTPAPPPTSCSPWPPSIRPSAEITWRHGRPMQSPW